MKNMFLTLLMLGFCFGLYAQHRYINVNEVGVLVYGTGSEEAGFTALTAHGFRYKAGIEFLGTTGAEKYQFDRVNTVWMLPISLGGNYVLKPAQRSSFFAGLQLGYGFAFLPKTESNWTASGGLKVNPQVGWRWKLGRRSLLQTAIGYQTQRVELKQKGAQQLQMDSYIPGFGSEVVAWERNVLMERLSLRLGFGF